MPWVILVLAALAGGALSGGVTFLVMEAKEAIAVSSAVKAERRNGVVTCNARVGEIERQHNAAVTAAVDEARRAAEAVSATPETPAEIMVLCQKSASCRERKQ